MKPFPGTVIRGGVGGKTMKEKINHEGEVTEGNR